MRWPDNLAHHRANRTWANVLGWVVLIATVAGSCGATAAVTRSCPGGDCSGDYLMYESAGMLVGLTVLVLGGTLAGLLLLFGHRHDGAAWTLVAVLALVAVAALIAAG